MVVGGAHRKSGKTLAVCRIIAATRQAAWTAIKVSSHGHGADLEQPAIEIEWSVGPDRDTSRYLAAGAVKAIWVRTRAETVEQALSGLLSGNVIIESNSVVDYVSPDLFVFVRGNREVQKKPDAARRMDQADVLVDGVVEADVLERIRKALEDERGGTEPTNQ